MNLAAASICATWRPAPAAADLDQECPYPPLRLSDETTGFYGTQTMGEEDSQKHMWHLPAFASPSTRMEAMVRHLPFRLSDESADFEDASSQDAQKVSGGIFVMTRCSILSMMAGIAMLRFVLG